MRRRLLALVVSGSLAAGALMSACGSDGGTDVKLSVQGERGRTVAEEQGCTSCHTSDGSKGVGPSWKGMAGSKIELNDGSTVVADDEYLRAAILDGRSQVVKGYANIMPVYKGELSDSQVEDLIAFLNDLAAPTPEN